MDRRERAQAVDAEIRAYREVTGKAADENEINRIVALHVIAEDGGDEQPGYLSELSKETLLLHGRQDAAHALLNTVSILKRQRRLERLVWILLIIVVGAIFLASK